MTHGRMIRIALIVVGLISVAPGIALADFSGDLARIPEPGTLTLLASGAAALGGIGWLRRRKK
jgi:PEP-CTERM motif-containing protein